LRLLLHGTGSRLQDGLRDLLPAFPDLTVLESSLRISRSGSVIRRKSRGSCR